MTKEYINVRNLQHVDEKLVYKGYSISANDYCSSMVWVAENQLTNDCVDKDTLSELLDEIDDITNT